MMIVNTGASKSTERKLRRSIQLHDCATRRTVRRLFNLSYNRGKSFFAYALYFRERGNSFLSRVGRSGVIGSLGPISKAEETTRYHCIIANLHKAFTAIRVPCLRRLRFSIVLHLFLFDFFRFPFCFSSLYIVEDYSCGTLREITGLLVVEDRNTHPRWIDPPIPFHSKGRDTRRDAIISSRRCSLAHKLRET